MSGDISLVRARYASRFCAALVARGIDPSPFLLEVGLDPNMLDIPEAWIPMPQLLGFLDCAVGATGYVTLGLDAGIAPRQEHSKFSKIVLYAPTLFQALRSICKKSALEDTSANFRVVRDQNFGWLECGSVAAPAEGIRQLESYRYAALLEIIRSAAGPEWLPPRLLLHAPRHPDICGSPIISGVDVRFDQKGLSIAMEPHLFSQSMVEVPGLPTTRPEFSESPIGFAMAVNEIVRAQVLAGNPALEDTARALRTSARTLQRRLLEQDMSYSGLLEHVRIETAKGWLRDTDDVISSIAARLAYKHPTHFSRAFARACGISPRAYRKIHHAQNSLHERPLVLR